MISSKISLTQLQSNNNLEYLTMKNINNNKNINKNENESEKTYNEKKFFLQ